MAPTFESKFAAVGDLNLHYLDWGERTNERVLVCLHGTSGSARHFDRLANILAPSYRVIALDQRGHGESDKPPRGYDAVTLAGDLAGFADQIGIGRFALLGASLGSRVATVYTGGHPERVARLILVDVSFEMPEEAQQRMIHGHLTRRRTFTSFEDALSYSQSMPQRSRWTPEMHREEIEHAIVKRPDGLWEWRYSLEAALQSLQQARQDLWNYVAKIQCPTLLIRGQESDVLTVSTAEKFLRLVKNCRSVEIEGAGHGVPRDNPERFNQVVCEFLKREFAT
ncbi:MAG TPA: alpha/beta hydrolase [Candidatus Acidoferrales bacterium]|nr:alpha/beta hydrolase [Candidatus Acidoferrales bacterium]